MGLGGSLPEPKIYINHERFAECEVKPEEDQIQSVIAVDFTPFDFEYWKKNLQQLKQDPNSDMLFLPKSYDQHLTSFTCSTNQQLKLSFENYPFLLQQQIRNRSFNSQPNYFEEEELWMLLYSLVKSQRAFCNLSLKVGDIHPHMVFINSKGYPRLACQFSWPNQKTNFEKMYYEKVLRYISPEQMKLCQRGLHPDLCYANTSDAFSIGLTMLGAGLLESLDRICDIKTFKFNQQYLQFCINRWMTLKFKHPETNELVTYSHELRDIVKNLCKINPHERFLPSKIYDLLQPYETQIMNIQKFSLRNYKPLSSQLSQQNNFNPNRTQSLNMLSFKPLNQQLPQTLKFDQKLTSSIQRPFSKGTNNTNHKVLFTHYATLDSAQNKGFVRNLHLNEFVSKEQIEQNRIQGNKKGFELEISESMIVQNSQTLKKDKQNDDASSLKGPKQVQKQQFKGEAHKNIQFKSSYFEPIKISKTQYISNATLANSSYLPAGSSLPLIFSLPQSSQAHVKSNFDSEMLLKIQKQIKESQQTFPQKSTLQTKKSPSNIALDQSKQGQ